MHVPSLLRTFPLTIYSRREIYPNKMCFTAAARRRSDSCTLFKNKFLGHPHKICRIFSCCIFYANMYLNNLFHYDCYFSNFSIFYSVPKCVSKILNKFFRYSRGFFSILMTIITLICMNEHEQNSNYYRLMAVIFTPKNKIIY